MATSMVLQHREEFKVFFILYGTEVLIKDQFFVGLCLWGGEWKQRRRVENSLDSKELNSNPPYMATLFRKQDA